MKRLATTLSIICILLTGCTKEVKSTKVQSNSNFAASKNKTMPMDAKNLLTSGVSNIENGNISEAILDLSDLTKLYPNYSVGFYNLGLAYIKNNQPKEAINAWKKTISLDNNYADAYFNLAQAYKMLNNKDKTVENLSKYLILRPKDPQLEQIKIEIEKFKMPVKGKGILGRIQITDSIDAENKLPLKSTNIFNNKTPHIYTFMEVSSAPQGTKLKANWYFFAFGNQKIPVNSSEMTIEGSKNIILELSNPQTGWLSGQYQVEILLNEKPNVALSFYVQN